MDLRTNPRLQGRATLRLVLESGQTSSVRNTSYRQVTGKQRAASIRQEVLYSSVSQKLRATAWTISEAVRDFLANHMPADAEGSRTWIYARIGGLRIPINQLTRRFLPAALIREIIFADDGIGYDPRNLVALKQSRKNRLCIGQHGEGLKLAQTALLRAGLEPEFVSNEENRSWQATSFFADVPEIPGAKRLACRITYCDLPPGKRGSQTIFRRPGKGAQSKNWEELVREVLQIPERFVEFQWGKRQYESWKPPSSTGEETYVARIYDLHPFRLFKRKAIKRQLFVKNTRVKEVNTVFDYDLGLEKVTVDRKEVEKDEYLEYLGKFLYQCRSRTVVSRILGAMANAENPDALDEARALTKAAPNATADDQAFWAEMFQKTFGRKAVLASGHHGVDKDAKDSGNRVVKLPNFIAGKLEDWGVEVAHNPDSMYDWVERDQLSAAELAILATLPRINERLGLKPGVEPPEVRIFSRMIDEKGKDQPGTVGVQQFGAILIRRSCLSSRKKFLEVYGHEMRHWKSGSADHDVEFVKAATTDAAAALERWVARRGL